MKRIMTLILCVTLTGLLHREVRADEPSKEDIAKAEIQSAAIADLGLAGELATFARDAKSPEGLVIAGGMLLRANKTFGGKSSKLDMQPTDENGKPNPCEEVKSQGLDKQAEALFDEARAIVAGDKTRTASLEVLITNTKKFEFGSSAETRPSVTGPKVTTRTLNPGQTHSFTVGFYSGVPASVAMTSCGPARIQFDITHVSGQNLFSLRGLNAKYDWIPVRDRDRVRRVKITLKNVGRNPTTYTLSTN